MAFQTPEGRGSLFKNFKKASEKSPDFKGELVLNEDMKRGQTIKLAAWEKQTSKGDSFFSISIDNWKPKEGVVKYPREQRNKDDDGGDLVF